MGDALKPSERSRFGWETGMLRSHVRSRVAQSWQARQPTSAAWHAALSTRPIQELGLSPDIAVRGAKAWIFSG